MNYLSTFQESSINHQITKIRNNRLKIYWNQTKYQYHVGIGSWY